MQEEIARLLRKAVSHERIEAYRERGTNGSDSNLFAHYAWNIAICESLYPALQGLEVALRNSIHHTIREDRGNNYWFDDRRLIHERDRPLVDKAKAKLTRMNKPHDEGRVIAELSFGFWTSLFDSRYEQRLWPRYLKTAFPAMPRTIRKRKTLTKRLNKLRYLRNRVFHHEPIWHWRDLQEQHQMLLETTSWINPAMQALITGLDRFDEVYNNRVVPYEALINQLSRP